MKYIIQGTLAWKGYSDTSSYALLLSNECKCLCIRGRFSFGLQTTKQTSSLIKTNWRLCLCDRKQYIVSQLSTTTLQSKLSVTNYWLSQSTFLAIMHAPNLRNIMLCPFRLKQVQSHVQVTAATEHIKVYGNDCNKQDMMSCSRTSI